jgi:hypothetical protein
MTAPALPAPFVAPSRNRQAWETLVVVYSDLEWPAPGIVTITGADIEDGYDVKEAQGQKGASTEKKGEKIKKFTSTHWLSDEPYPEGTFDPIEGVDIVDDHVQWTAFQWVLRQAMTSEPPRALSVRHPKLQIKEIFAAVPAKIAGPNPNDDGSTVFAVDWQEYRPVVRTGGPGKDKPDGRTETDDAIDKALAEIDKLQKEYEEL